MSFYNWYVQRTPLSRVLFEQLKGLYLVKKFPTVYGTRPVPILSQINPVYGPPYHFLKIRFSIISYIHLGLQSVSFPQISPPNPGMRLSSPLYMLHAPSCLFFLI